MSEVVRIESGSLSFQGKAAISDLSVSFGDRDRSTCIGLVGTNGSGKSSLANIISGYYRLDTGRVFLQDSDVTNTSPEARAKMGIRRSFQSVDDISGMRVEEFMMLGWEAAWRSHLLGSVFGGRRAARFDVEVRARVISAMEDAGIAAYVGVPFESCPYGVRKLADAVRVVSGPPGAVAMFDEPSSGVAQQDRAALSTALRQSVDSAKFGLVVVIDHDLPFVRSVCSKLFVLEAGQLIAHGATDDVLAMARVQESFAGAAAAT